MNETPRPNLAGLSDLMKLTRASILQSEESIASAFRGLDLTGWRRQRAEMQRAIDALGEQKRAADALSRTARQRLAEVDALIAPQLPPLEAVINAIETARDADSRLRQQIASTGIQLLNEQTRAALNSATSWRAPAHRMAVLGALGAAAREAGIEQLVTEAGRVFEGLDDAATAAAADATAANRDTLPPEDVALGLKALYWILALWLTVWINTGDDVARHGVGLLLEWVGAAGAIGAAGHLVHKTARDGHLESGG